MDREKVIKGLQAHADGCGYRSHHCDAMECPYRYGDESCDIEEMCRDALELLKEQEELGKELENAIELIHKKNARIEILNTVLNEQPQIVRCKDCIYGEHEKNESTGMEWIYCAHHRESRPKEWYCASGSPTIKQKGR